MSNLAEMKPLQLTTPVLLYEVSGPDTAKTIEGRITGRSFFKGEYLYDFTPDDKTPPRVNIPAKNLKARGEPLTAIPKLSALPPEPRWKKQPELKSAETTVMKNFDMPTTHIGGFAVLGLLGLILWLAIA